MDWNNIIYKVHFTPKYFMKQHEIIKKKKKKKVPFCDRTTPVTYSGKVN